MSRQQRGTARTVLVLVGCLLVIGPWWWATHDSAGTDGSSTSARETQTSSVTSGQQTRDTGGLPAITVTDLPREARDTLELIEAGGPFPYERDGVVFQNRERILPAKQRGYYREYTVRTPGEDDRGARRIVTGQQGERYWTADHYDSFLVITEEP
jgi:ribonuclease T1